MQSGFVLYETVRHSTRDSTGKFRLVSGRRAKHRGDPLKRLMIAELDSFNFKIWILSKWLVESLIEEFKKLKFSLKGSLDCKPCKLSDAF